MLHSTLSIGLDDSAAAAVPPPVYDPDAEALFGRMTVPPVTTRKNLINNEIVALKSLGIWDLLDLLYVFAAHDEQAARLNWKASAFTCTAVAGMPFVADRGFQGNGTSYLATGWAADNGVQFQQDSAHMAGWSLGSVNNSSLVGNTNATPPRTLLMPVSNNTFASVSLNDGTPTAIINSNGAGFFIGNRSGASARQVYHNRSLLGSDAEPSTGLSTSAVTFNRDGTTIGAAFIAQASLGGSLSALLADGYYSAMFEYMRGVGAA